MYNPYNCKTCGFADPTHTLCQLRGTAITENDFCSKHAPERTVCDNCRNLVRKPLIYITEDKSVKYVCPDCFQRFSTCTFCEHAKICYFSDDTSGMPKIVTKTVNMGNGMVAQTQIRNPDLIEITCKQKCNCYQEGECMREYTFCKNHKFSSPF